MDDKLFRVPYHDNKLFNRSDLFSDTLPDFMTLKAFEDWLLTQSNMIRVKKEGQRDKPFVLKFQDRVSTAATRFRRSPRKMI
jgi:hypothetical protein